MDLLKPPYNLATSGSATVRIGNSVEIASGETYEVKMNWGKVFQQDGIFQAWRGDIINNSLFIEEQLEIILFKIFRKEFGVITFMDKWKKLGEMFHSIEPYKERDYSLLRTDLLEIINIRNKFAHGKLTHFGDNSEKMIIEYFSEGVKREEINEKTIGDFIELVKKCREKLNEIISELRKI